MKATDTTGHEFLKKAPGFILVTTSFYKRSFLEAHSLKFSEELTYGEDSFFDIQFDLFNPTIKTVNCRIYMYHINESSALHSRSKSNCRRVVEQEMLFFSKFRKLIDSDILREAGLQNCLLEIGRKNDITARVLSSDLSIKEFRQIKGELRAMGFVPFLVQNMPQRMMSTVYKVPYLLKVYQFLYRNIAMRYIIPRMKL